VIGTQSGVIERAEALPSVHILLLHCLHAYNRIQKFVSGFTQEFHIMHVAMQVVQLASPVSV
jgi:hypothetical protein